MPARLGEDTDTSTSDSHQWFTVQTLLSKSENTDLQ
jgi:hypothetical protein